MCGIPSGIWLGSWHMCIAPARERGWELRWPAVAVAAVLFMTGWGSVVTCLPFLWKGQPLFWTPPMGPEDPPAAVRTHPTSPVAFVALARRITPF